MSDLVTNIYPILNLKNLSAEYKLYRVVGLNPQHDEYHQNCQHLRRKLSFGLQKPVTVIERDANPYLVVRADAKEPPSPYPLVRATVNFEPVPGNFRLDFTVRSAENDEICLRFLQFMLQEPLRARHDMWQPASGQPFFEKTAESLDNGILRYRGYAVRALVTPQDGIGLCVGVTNKFVAENALPNLITRDEFPKWKSRHCIYHYGHQWYEIRIDALDGRNASNYYITRDGQYVNLIDYIVTESQKPIPPELTAVPHDAAVIVYRNNRNEERGAPAPLCYPVLSTEMYEAAALHSETILPPHKREKMAKEFVAERLTILRFGSTVLRVGDKPLFVPRRMFSVPDLKFGAEKTLSVQGTRGAQQVSLDNLGASRLALLKEAGFYCHDPLARQYFILPRSVAEGYGKQMLADITGIVNELFPQENSTYDPVIVTYNDAAPRTSIAQ
ncbi:MAG: hypothetical protein M1305_02085, partial [Candidatus Marsarchaeota archaeon]|nr:hypothetical protein [Candidatus Marsarchaeota archaeon]